MVASQHSSSHTQPATTSPIVKDPRSDRKGYADRWYADQAPGWQLEPSCTELDTPLRGQGKMLTAHTVVVCHPAHADESYRLVHSMQIVTIACPNRSTGISFLRSWRTMPSGGSVHRLGIDDQLDTSVLRSPGFRSVRSAWMVGAHTHHKQLAWGQPITTRQNVKYGQ